MQAMNTLIAGAVGRDVLGVSTLVALANLLGIGAILLALSGDVTGLSA